MCAAGTSTSTRRLLRFRRSLAGGLPDVRFNEVIAFVQELKAH